MRRPAPPLLSIALLTSLSPTGSTGAADTVVNAPDVEAPDDDALDVPGTTGPSSVSLPAR